MTKEELNENIQNDNNKNLDAENFEYEEDTQKDKYLTFLLDNEEYGIEIKFVMEIIGFQAITEVPELPDYIRGIINLRGKIIPVIDVRLRFKKPFKEYNDRTCVIVINIEGLDVGFIVDSVSEVVNISQENVVDPPSSGIGFSNKYIKGIAKNKDDVKLILDCYKLLENENLEELTEKS